MTRGEDCLYSALWQADRTKTRRFAPVGGLMSVDSRWTPSTAALLHVYAVHAFTANLAPQRKAGKAQRREFIPTTFYRQFSSVNKPVLTISPGDTVHATTVDAGGTDEKGVTRVLGGNPETGPFFVETAEPGDTLVVHLVTLRALSFEVPTLPLFIHERLSTKAVKRKFAPELSIFCTSLAGRISFT